MTRQEQFRNWAIGAVVFFGLLYLFGGVLTPFVAGMAVAYFLDPLADRLERAGLSRLQATAVITGVFVIVLVAFVLLLFPIVQNQVLTLATQAPAYLGALLDRLQPIVAEIRAQLPADKVDELGNLATSHATDALRWFGDALRNVVSGGLAVFGVLSTLFITPIVAFYMLRDWDRMLAMIDVWLPRHHRDEIRQAVREIDETLAGFIRGQASVCLVLGAFYAIGLSLVGLDVGVLVGIGAGLISFIPYLGSITGFVVSIGLALAQFTEFTDIALVGAVFLVGQAIEGNYLTPKLVGERVKLHPVIVIFALLAGGALFGFVGVLLAVPVAAVIGVLARIALKRYLRSPMYTGGELAETSSEALDNPGALAEDRASE